MRSRGRVMIETLLLVEEGDVLAARERAAVLRPDGGVLGGLP